MTVRLRSLVQDMHRYLDLATFDVVVNLEGEKPSYTARIRVPYFRRVDVTHFLSSFQVTDVTCTYHPFAPNWIEITFPIIPFEDMSR